jgi:hypothetical protein
MHTQPVRPRLTAHMTLAKTTVRVRMSPPCTRTRRRTQDSIRRATAVDVCTTVAVVGYGKYVSRPRADLTADRRTHWLAASAHTLYARCLVRPLVTFGEHGVVQLCILDTYTCISVNCYTPDTRVDAVGYFATVHRAS